MNGTEPCDGAELSRHRDLGVLQEFVSVQFFTPPRLSKLGRSIPAKHSIVCHILIALIVDCALRNHAA